MFVVEARVCVASRVSGSDGGSTAPGGRQLEHSPESTTGRRADAGALGSGAGEHHLREEPVCQRGLGRDPSLRAQDVLTHRAETRSHPKLPEKEFAFRGTA